MFIIKTTIVAALLAVAAVLVLATLIRATETVMAPPPSVVSEATP